MVRRSEKADPEEALSAKLFSEYSVLILQVLDDIALVAIDPPREEHHEKLEG